MNYKVPCGLEVGQTLAHFCSRMLILGYYDGPTAGIIECRQNQHNYRFDLLDWDNQQDVRIFSLAKLMNGSLERISLAYSDENEPTWPTWMPSWKFNSADHQRAVEECVTEVLGRYELPIYIIASMGIRQPIIYAALASELQQKWIIEESLAQTPQVQKQVDWFTHLSLTR